MPLPRRILPATLASAFWASGCAATTPAVSSTSSLREPTTAPSSIAVTIEGLDANGAIATESTFAGFGCQGKNRSLALRWSSVSGAKSYALVMHDLDAPTGVGFFHWVAFDIPPGTTSLPAGASKSSMPGGSVEAHTDFGSAGYGGPCPPPGTPHRYEVTVYAVDAPMLGLEASATGALARVMLGQQTIALGRASATYAR